MKYEIKGGSFPIVVCHLSRGEQMITEKGSMVWMTPNMTMETKGGGVGKMFSKAFSGENLFQNIYTAKGGQGVIAMASSFPGNIIAVEITPGNDIICQKSAFLASTRGVELSIHFQKKLGAGFFGGEGFIMQRISGNGVAFLEFDGHIKEYDLQPGQSIIVDTGYLAAMSTSCSIDIQTVPGIKNALLGGEGIFNTVITGPGHVWIQTMPVYQMANTLRPYFPSGNNK